VLIAQRLQALTTGGLPTFLDVGRWGLWLRGVVRRFWVLFYEATNDQPCSNFDAAVVEEDTWVRQLHRNGKKLLFMGDDTWQSMFPEEYFSRAFFYPSFDVKVWL
jgi:phosphatidylinositol glycan class O